MLAEPCAEWALLIQADIDGELPAADAAKVTLHVAGCAECARVQADLLNLRTQLRSHAPRYTASAALRAAVSVAPNNTAASRWRPGVAFVSGIAVAASVLLLLPITAPPNGPEANLVSAHLRALQPGHLTDVISTDQHTVKPWFDGRLTFTPTVKDLAAEGFPLVGGRLDVVNGHEAAVMVYRRRDHMIDVFAWPDSNALAASGQREGYAWVGWQHDGIAYWAVSSLNQAELLEFVADLK